MKSKEALASAIAGRLADGTATLSSAWNNPCGTRTRHFVIDDLLPANVCAEISASFPSDFSECLQRKSFRERKKTLAKVYKSGPLIEAIIYAFQQQAVVNAVESITGLNALLPDAKLYAGGISMMGKGDFLNPHIDNSHNVDKTQYRRLNLLYYTTPGWETRFGGNLELWDDRVKSPVTITSRFNRLVVMETTKYSWHSVSPVCTDRIRQCVSNYYFSAESPGTRNYYHVTSFLGRPEQPLRRLLGYVDNAARNTYVKITGHSRGWIQQNDKALERE